MKSKRILSGVLAAVSLFSFAGCFYKPEAGQITVIRNGGPFDNHKIRQIVDNGAGNTWIGFFSESHPYPVDSQQRFFKMCSNEDGSQCKDSDSPAITVPTSDGVEVSINGIVYLNTGFNNSKAGSDLLKDFDTQFSTRTFSGKHPYEGSSGWSKFLGAIVEPVIANNFRSTISGVGCAELVSSCALVQNGGSKTVDVTKNKSNQNNVQRIESTVNQSLVTDLRNTLTKDYFKNIKFNLTKVQLPAKIQNAIDDAQSAFAQVSQAQAKVQSAALESKANEVRQKGYNKCPTCAKIDALKSLPRGLKALGGNTVLGIQ